MNKKERYALGLLSEECGEVVQQAGKALRFGLDTEPAADWVNSTPRRRIELEAGDVLAAIEYATARGVLDPLKIDAQRAVKLATLMDAGSKDRRGRRLAP